MRSKVCIDQRAIFWLMTVLLIMCGCSSSGVPIELNLTEGEGSVASEQPTQHTDVSFPDQGDQPSQIFPDAPADQSVDSLLQCDIPHGWKVIAVPYQDGFITPSGAFDGDRDAILVHGSDGRIWRYPTTGETPPEAISSSQFTQFHPSLDGRLIAAVKEWDQSNTGDVWLIDTQSGEEKRLDLKTSSVGDWRATGESFFFTTWREGIGEFDLVQGTVRWWAREVDFPRDYRATRSIVEIPGLPYSVDEPPRLSPDGGQLLFSGWGSHITSVFRLDLATERLYVYPGTETDGVAAVWHPDGHHALFGIPGNGVLDLETGAVTTRRGDGGGEYHDVGPDARALRYRYTEGLGCWLIGQVPGLDS